MVAEKVETESAFYLHFAGLGLRNLVAEAVRSGELSQSFRDRAEAGLWGLECHRGRQSAIRLPLDAVKSVVETALSCSEDQLHGVDPIINIAERARWLERSEMRALLADWDEGRLACGPWTGAVDALRRLLLDGWRPGATGS